MSSLVLAGHRGFKTAYPENTILSYDAAIDNGCLVVETDLHISADDEIAIAHDIDTRRVFGVGYKIPEESYKETLSKLRTVREPHLPMPTFKDVLEWFVKKLETTKKPLQLMLDIKQDCDPAKLMELIFANLKEVGPSVEFYHEKLIFGMWDPKYYNKLMDPFSIINITFDINIAKKVVPAIQKQGGTVGAISILDLVLYNEKLSNELYNYCQETGIKIWFWTINDRKQANDSVKFCKTKDGSLLAGMITDDPVTVLADPVEPTLLERIQGYLKQKCYLVFLYLLHNNYNMGPIFRGLASIGLI